MNQLGIDVLDAITKHGYIENQGAILQGILDNIDRVTLNRDVDKCTQCGLHKSTSHKALGKGPRSAPIMIIGDYSGDMENAIGVPFAGPSGKLLDQLLFDACIDKAQVYITNPVKCHPPYNRKPEVQELSCCAKQFLSKELDIIKPKHIVAMGEIAASLFTTEPLSKMQGKTIKSRGYTVTFTYHPNSIICQTGESYTNMYNFTVEDLSRTIIDLLKESKGTSICRKMTKEEEWIQEIDKLS